MKFIRISALAALVALSSLGSAASVDSISASVSQDASQSDGPGGSFFAVSFKASLTQQLRLSPTEVGQLNSDTTVLPNLMFASTSFKFSDDPNWTPGATKVSIKKPISEGPVQGYLTLKMSWANGIMKFKYKLSAKGAGQDISATSKIRATQTISTEFSQSGNPIFSVSPTVQMALEHTQSQKVDFAGNETESMSIKVETGAFANP